jgi:hypothetical protein
MINLTDAKPYFYLPILVALLILSTNALHAEIYSLSGSVTAKYYISNDSVIDSIKIGYTSINSDELDVIYIDESYYYPRPAVKFTNFNINSQFDKYFAGEINKQNIRLEIVNLNGARFKIASVKISEIDDNQIKITFKSNPKSFSCKKLEDIGVLNCFSVNVEDFRVNAFIRGNLTLTKRAW